MAATEAAVAEEIPSSNGWFQLVVPGDGSAARLKKIVRHTGNGKPVEAVDILKKLKEQKVVYGIDVDAIENVLNLVEASQIPEEAVIIACSDVTEGSNGQLQWCIDGIGGKDVELIVAPDMPVAIRRRAIKGKPGRNIFGKSRQARPVFDPQLNAGTGIRVEENADGEFVYVTNYAGELRYEEDTVSVEHHVTVSEDHMQAHMHIPAGRVEGAMQAITEQDILAVIASRNVTQGILTENIQAALKEQGDQPGFIKNVLVAQGKPAIDGVNSRLLVDEHLAIGKLLDNGKIDFHEKSYPWNIKAGEVLGQVLSAQSEENGFTVLGKIICATPAEEARLVLEGIRQEADGSLRSLQDGVLLVNGFNISVTDSLVIKGDVCHRTGNIHSDQTVIVKGYVEPGFVLESKGDLIIEDNVEQSLVRGNGSVVVKSGIRGSQSTVISRGNISASFIENARVKALGDINVENSLVNCYSYCQGTLYVGNANARKSTLIGGSTHAVKGIVAANLGSEGCNKTVVNVGAKPESLRRLKNITEELGKRESILNELEYLYAQKKQNQLQSHDEKLEIIGKTCRTIRQEFELLILEKEKWQARIEASRKATVIIHQHVYPGVCIRILDKSYEVRKKENAGIFFLEDELIIFRPAA